MSNRRDRVSDLIRAEVSRLLLHEMRDPRIGFVTITGATISPDLKNVRIFVSVLGDAKAREDSLHALNSAAGYFRRTLFHNLGLRYAPHVAFRFDDSLDRGERIDQVLKTIRELEANRPSGDEEE